jgi:hypothetical protein
MKLKPGFAAGYCAPAICPGATSFLSRRNFWLKCSVCPAHQRDFSCTHASWSRHHQIHPPQNRILDVEGLQDTACECYETIKEQYGQLLGPFPRSP